jgi:hypothetical protein
VLPKDAEELSNGCRGEENRRKWLAGDGGKMGCGREEEEELGRKEVSCGRPEVSTITRLGGREEQTEGGTIRAEAEGMNEGASGRREPDGLNEAASGRGGRGRVVRVSSTPPSPRDEVSGLSSPSVGCFEAGSSLGTDAASSACTPCC